MSSSGSFSLRGVHAGYGGREVLTGADLTLARGEVLGLVGPNGAGKSTLLRVMTRQLTAAAGEVMVDGVSLARLGRFELARLLAVVVQSPPAPPGFTVEELVAMGRTPHLGLLAGPGRADREAVERALAATATAALRHRRLETLSGGELQRAVLARALAQQPSYLVLDEPTNHLDLRFQLEVLAMARSAAASGKGVLLVLHDLNLAARSCDRLAVLHQGRIVAEGPPGEVLTAGLIEQVYGTPVEVHDIGGKPVVVGRLPG